jgi:hypothetical protein
MASLSLLASLVPLYGTFARSDNYSFVASTATPPLDLLVHHTFRTSKVDSYISLELLDPGIQHILQIARMRIIARSQLCQFSFHRALELRFVLEELLQALELCFVRVVSKTVISKKVRLMLVAARGWEKS